MTSNVTVLPVETAADRKRFIRVPVEIYASEKGFVAPLDFEREEALSQKKNPYFEHAKAKYWLAYKDGEIAGRISAQVDELAMETYDERIGFFGFIDAIDDADVFAALFQTAEDWLKENQITKVRGPFSHSINDECGLMIDGFEATPMLLMPFHPAYADAHVKAAGYDKGVDTHAFSYQVGSGRETYYLDRLQKKMQNVSIRQLNMKDYDADIRRIVEIFNDAWSDNWGFVPYTNAEVDHLAESMKLILDPELVIIVELEGKPVSMVVCLPNLTEAIDGLDGKLFPFGWAKLLWRLKVKGVKSCRIPLMGIRRKFHDSFYGAMMVRTMLEQLEIAMKKKGYTELEASWILEDNLPMRRILESIGSEIYKTYRIYEKALA